MAQVSESSELLLEARYTVWVAEQGTKTGRVRREAELQSKIMYRVINLLNVAMEFCASYGYDISRACFLRSHPGALRAVYRVAVAFRNMLLQQEPDILDLERPPNRNLQSFENDQHADAGSRDFPFDAGPKWKSELCRIEDDMRTGIIPVSFLFPGETSRKRSLETKLLRMDHVKFEQLYHRGRKMGQDLEVSSSDSGDSQEQ